MYLRPFITKPVVRLLLQRGAALLALHFQIREWEAGTRFFWPGELEPQSGSAREDQVEFVGAAETLGEWRAFQGCPALTSELQGRLQRG